MDVPILMGIIYLIVCWLAGNIWFDWKILLTLIAIESVYDIIIVILRKLPDKVKTDDE